MTLLRGRRDTHWRTPFFGPSHPKERRPSDLHRADKTLKHSVQIRSKHGGMPRAIAFRKVLGSRLGRASGRRVANIEWQITPVAPQLYRPVRSLRLPRER